MARSVEESNCYDRRKRGEMSKFEPRRIDGKFHIDFNFREIFKTSSSEVVPRNEPLFLFRARDYLAVPLLEHYRKMCELDGCTDYQLRLLDEQIADFKRFAENNPNKMKQPGITRGAVYKEK